MGNCIKKIKKSEPTSAEKKSSNNSSSTTQAVCISNISNLSSRNSYIIQNNFNKMNDHFRVRSIFKYTARQQNELSFDKDEILIVISDLSMPWWLAYKPSNTADQGWIPCNYVAIDDGSPQSIEGWYKISRQMAEKKLLSPGNPEGTYLLRPSSSSMIFALSVRYKDLEKSYFVVLHFKIYVLDQNKGYYLQKGKYFNDCRDLIKFYYKNDSLGCKLVQPCPKSNRPPIQFKDLEVKRDCIKLKHVLGSGSFGMVYLAKWNNFLDVAVKILKESGMNRDKFLREAEIMHNLNHPNIVQLMGICTENENKPVYIITELMMYGSLLGYLKTSNGHKLQYNERIDIMAQIADGMAFLEKKNFVHCDLRTANILVDEDCSVKVGDFGLTKMLDGSSEEDFLTKFPLRWTAPEAAIKRKFSTKSDVWSFGIVIYEIITNGIQPYKDLSNDEVIMKVNEGIRLKNPHVLGFYCPGDLYNLMLSCWNGQPEERPTFNQLEMLLYNWDNKCEYLRC